MAREASPCRRSEGRGRRSEAFSASSVPVEFRVGAAWTAAAARSFVRRFRGTEPGQRAKESPKFLKKAPGPGGVVLEIRPSRSSWYPSECGSQARPTTRKQAWIRLVYPPKTGTRPAAEAKGSRPGSDHFREK